MAVAEEIGVAFETLRRWCGAARKAPRAMVPVRVVTEPAARTVSVCSAAGFRVDGLTVAEAIAVLRALG